MRSIRIFAALVAVSVVFAPAAWAEPTEVGTTAASNTDTTGTPPRMATRNLFIGTNVFFEERIETSKTGQTQLLFLDESALTIGSNSDVVLDKFVYDPKTSKGELALSIGAGLFRFVGGRISKTAGVRIETPTATIGIRGGIAIVKVEPGTTRATWLFGKAMTVRNKKTGATTTVTRPGFSVDVGRKEISSPFKETGLDIALKLIELEGKLGNTTCGDRCPNKDDKSDDEEDAEDIIGATAANGGTDDGPPGLFGPIDPIIEGSCDGCSGNGNGNGNGVAITTRTLNGFSGGVFLESATESISIFGNTNDDPADIQIDTDVVSGTTSNGIVTATFDVQVHDATGGDQQIVADFGGTGETSAFFDDTNFLAIEASATSATFEGATVTNALLFMATSAVFDLDLIPLNDGVNFCQCEFLQWGFWGADLELSSGDFVNVPLANWVAGEISSLADFSKVLGSATYSGHAIGTVIDGFDIRGAVGGFTQIYNFDTMSGPFSVTDFDIGKDTYTGSVNAISGQENLFTGSGTGAGRDIELTGAFFSGGGDPVAEVGGGFTIEGNDYQASGIFAATK